MQSDFAEQNKLVSFGQKSPIIGSQYSKLSSAKRIPSASVPQPDNPAYDHLSQAVSMLFFLNLLELSFLERDHLKSQEIRPIWLPW